MVRKSKLIHINRSPIQRWLKSTCAPFHSVDHQKHTALARRSSCLDYRQLMGMRISLKKKGGHKSWISGVVPLWRVIPW